MVVHVPLGKVVRGIVRVVRMMIVGGALAVTGILGAARGSAGVAVRPGGGARGMFDQWGAILRRRYHALCLTKLDKNLF